MRQQVARLSPHQNAKVAAVMMAATSLVFLIPAFLILSLFGAGHAGMRIWMILVVPLFYLVVGYIAGVIGCAIYNVVVPLTGGFEFDSTDERP